MTEQEWAALAKMVDEELESIAEFAGETTAPRELGSAVDDLIPKDDDFTHLASVLTCRRMLRDAQAPPLDQLQKNIVEAATVVVDTFSGKGVPGDQIRSMQALVAAVRAARVTTGEID